MAGVFDHLHLKRHTVGSSNELSFDVLDAARSDLDARAERKNRFPKTPTASKGSYHGVKGTATFSGVPEVKKRKQARRAHSLLIWVAVAFVVAAAAAVFVWFGYRHYLEVQNFEKQFDGLVSQFVAQDEFLAEVDDLMGKIYDDSTSKERTRVLSESGTVLEELSSISESARAMHDAAVNDSDRQALDQVVLTADARVEMLKCACNTFTLMGKCQDQTQIAQNVWNGVVNAVQSAKEASTAANKATTKEQTKEARDQTQAAIDSLKSSSERLQAIASNNADMDLAAEMAYIDLKVAALTHAVETADALLESDKDLAREKNDAYNEADKKAAEFAKTLPVSMGNVVDKAFQEDLDQSVASYNVARDKVISADSLVRDYLSKR